MTEQYFPPIRYGDDWIVLTSSESEASDGFQCATAALSRILIEINTEKSGIGSLEEESIVFLGHKIGVSGIDADLKGWQRFAKALGDFKNARTPEDLSRARNELVQLKSFYRNAGRIE
jgi:hypothetical protein